MSLSWFSCESSILVELEFEDVGFCGGRKPEYTEKIFRSKARTNNKLNPHMAPGRNQTQATLVGGKHPHHCPVPAPPLNSVFTKSK